eukprot:gene35351-41696_t
MRARDAGAPGPGLAEARSLHEADTSHIDLRNSGFDMAQATTTATPGAGILAGKRGVIMVVANNRSVAWGLAKAAHEAGAQLAFTYQGDALEKRVRPLAAELGADVVGHCDVTDASTIDAVFDTLAKNWGTIDFVVHCIAFSDKD